MAFSTLETKAHELLGHLEVMIHDDEDSEWSAHNAPIPHEQVLAEFGLSMTGWEKMSREP